MVNLISNIVAHSVRQIFFSSKSPRNRKKCKVTLGRLICEFTAVDDPLDCAFVHVVHNIFSWIQSRAVERLYLFPKYSKHFVNPLAELLGSFERNHRVTRRRLNPVFRLIFGQYSNFRGPQCIIRGYMDTRMTWI